MVDNATSCPACGAPMPSRSVSGVYACLYCGTRVNIEGQPVPEPEAPAEPDPEANLPEILKSEDTPEAPTNVREAIETLNEIPEARETVQTVVSTGKRWLVIALLASVGLCVLCVGVTVLFLVPMFR